MPQEKKSSHKTSQVKYALISVFDKTGIVELAGELVKLNYHLISTGGTAKVLEQNKISYIPIQQITGNPESFDGRMKTISFEIESGILFDRTNSMHVKEAKALKIKPIDIVVCNLYPFEKTVSKKTVTINEAVENIDVGGPTMIRAAAKNFKNVLVLSNPADYGKVVDALKNKSVKPELKQELAAKAFHHLSFYDAQIATFLSKEKFPQETTLPGRKSIDLRYGENPHQKGAIYITPNQNSVFENLKKQWGRDLSLTNVLDINAGLEVIRQFQTPAAVVIKHNSPCGIALGNSTKQALERAIEADPESAFGGVIVVNTVIDKDAASIIGKFKDEKRGNMDIIAAPFIDEDALSYLQKVRKSMGIYTFGKIPTQKEYQQVKWIDGGFLLQTGDQGIEEGFTDWKVATKKKPSKLQLQQMQIAWKFISRIRSNAILVMDPKLPMTRGIGSGQTSRVRSTKIALEQAKEFCKNGILASDSFFPFDDSIQLAHKVGISTIVQQGGSINDKLCIETADKFDMVMVMTGRRAFWH